MPRLLVVEGNIASDRRRIAESAGATPGESYAKVLNSLAPEARVDICTPADADASLAAPLDAYDGVAITGSALNIYKREPGSLRQIDFLRQAFGCGVPIFGSCWGLQLAAVAAGGDVGPNPRGREVAFARKIILTEAGLAHPMHEGRAPAFDAPSIHGDELVRLPDETIVTAWNEMSRVQAAEIRYDRGVFWGVQYHPEYDLRDVATTVRRYGKRLVDEGFFADATHLERYADDLLILEENAARRDISWRLGLGEDIVQPNKRLCEIANWIERQVRPRAVR
ncbi:MAG TPA: type 1 glutamine amidotransferase [Roseiarcus sp.]|nr:type 1 glutamine amidotransferase [Roseiarcus sp.]